MTTLSALKVIMSKKNYCQIAINTFKGYAYNDIKNIFFWEVIYINFE